MPIIAIWIVTLLLVMSVPAAGLCAADAPAIPHLPVRQVAPGNFVHYGSFEERSPQNFGDNANIGFIVGKTCVMAVDTGGSFAVGRALRQAIRRITPLPVCYVVLTHVHPDHFFGAAAFVDDHPQFIAHKNYPAQLAARSRSYSNSLRRDLGAAAAGSEIIPPSVLVDEQLEIDLGGRTVIVRAWPPAHTDDDLTVFDQRSRTMWFSDLLFVRHTPVVDGTIVGFVAVMKQMRGLELDHYVAGHGPDDLPWPQALDEQLRYLTLILDETRTAIRQRKTIQQASDEVGLSEAGHWMAFELFHRRNVTAAYAELEWE